MARRRALVTGASSGIGRAAALELSSRGFDLVLVSRDRVRLEETASACRARGAAVQVAAQDLSRPGAAAMVAAVLRERSLPVDVLVNNAGFGLHGPFSGMDVQKERDMVAVHVTAVMELTRLLLPGMIARGWGRILNVGSVYCFSPVPGQAVYGATKSFLWSFSQSLSGELADTGVAVTVLAPGSVRTEFRERAGVEETRSLSGLDAARVAEAGVSGMLAGRFLVVPGAMNKLFVVCARLLGHRFLPVISAINRWRGLRPA